MARPNEKPYVYVKDGDIENALYGATSTDIQRQDPDFPYGTIKNMKWKVSKGGNQYKKYKGNYLVRFKADKGKMPKRKSKRN